MSDINIQSLIETTRRVQEQQALEIIDGLPEVMRAAASRAEPWTVVMPFFVVPGLGILSFEGKKGDLTGTPKIVHDHLKAHDLSPGFVRQAQIGYLPDGSPIEGILYRLVARWDVAPEHNQLRQEYEKAVALRAKEITDRVPEMLSKASAAGIGWFNVHEFFSSPNLPDLGFDGDPQNLRGVPHLVYEYLKVQKLNPQVRVRAQDFREVGGCEWKGSYFYITGQWYDGAAPDYGVCSSEQSLAW